MVAQLEHQLRSGRLTLQALWYYVQPPLSGAAGKGGKVLSGLHVFTCMCVHVCGREDGWEVEASTALTSISPLPACALPPAALKLVAG